MNEDNTDKKYDIINRQKKIHCNYCKKIITMHSRWSHEKSKLHIQKRKVYIIANLKIMENEFTYVKSDVINK